MFSVVDFKNQSRFSLEDLIDTGFYLGGNIYRKFYVIENLYRIIIHSILSVQVPSGSDWWLINAPDKIQTKAKERKINYSKAGIRLPGKHLIYYTYLRELNEITRGNSGAFAPIISNIDEIVFKINNINEPRNMVAHMNFPGEKDKQLVDDTYEEFRVLIRIIQDKKDVLTLKIPK
jgi:hypothetical protein